MAARDNSLDPNAMLAQLPSAPATVNGVETNGQGDPASGSGGGVIIDPQPEPQQPVQQAPPPPPPAQTRPPEPTMTIGQGRQDEDTTPAPASAPAQAPPAAAQPVQQKPDSIPFPVFERYKKDWQTERDARLELEAQNRQLLDYYNRYEPMRAVVEKEWPALQGLKATAAQQKAELEIERATREYAIAEYSAGRVPDVDAFVRQKRTDLLLQQAANLPQTIEQIVQQQLHGTLDHRDQTWQQQQQLQAQQAEAQRRQQLVANFEQQYEQFEIQNPEIAGNAGWKQHAFIQWAQGNGQKPVNEVMTPYLRGIQTQRAAAVAAQPTRPEVHAAMPRLSTGSPGAAAPSQNARTGPPKEYLAAAAARGESPIAASARWHRQQLATHGR